MWEEIGLKMEVWGWGGEVSVDKAEGPRMCFHITSANEAEGKENICEETDHLKAQDMFGGSMLSRRKDKVALLSGCG